jgi:hypothetical protein
MLRSLFNTDREPSDHPTFVPYKVLSYDVAYIVSILHPSNRETFAATSALISYPTAIIVTLLVEWSKGRLTSKLPCTFLGPEPLP